jgi:hypothetical protein
VLVIIRRIYMNKNRKKYWRTLKENCILVLIGSAFPIASDITIWLCNNPIVLFYLVLAALIAGFSYIESK